MPRSIARVVSPAALCLVAGALGGLALKETLLPARGASPAAPASVPAPAPKLTLRVSPDAPAVYAPDWDKAYPQYQPLGKVLQPCPPLKAGEIPPQDLSVFGGAGKSSYSSVDEVGN